MHIYKRVCIRPSVLRNLKNLKQRQNTKHQTCKHSTGKRHVKSEINDIESDMQNVTDGWSLFSSDRAAHEVRGSKAVGATNVSIVKTARFGKVSQHKLSGFCLKRKRPLWLHFLVRHSSWSDFLPPKCVKEEKGEKLSGLGGTISTEVQDFAWTHPPIPWTRESCENKIEICKSSCFGKTLNCFKFEDWHWWSCLWHEWNYRNLKIWLDCFGVWVCICLFFPLVWPMSLGLYLF